MQRPRPTEPRSLSGRLCAPSFLWHDVACFVWGGPAWRLSTRSLFTPTDNVKAKIQAKESRASAAAPACKTLPVCAGLRRPSGVIANLAMNMLVACAVLCLTVNFAAYDECIAVNRNRLMHALLGNSSVCVRLETDLMSHGVPQDQARSRAQALEKAVGETALQQTMLSTDDKVRWVALKRAANHAQFRLLSPDEATNFHASNKAKRKSGPLDVEDPWIVNDPWKQSAPSTASLASPNLLRSLSGKEIGLMNSKQRSHY